MAANPSVTTPDGLCLDVTKKPFSAEDAQEVLHVGTRRAAYYPDAAALDVDLGAGRVLELGWDPERIPLTRDDVVRFAAGVHVMTD